MQSQLSNELNDILAYAKEEAMRLGNYTVSTDHLVLGMLRHRENAVVETLVQLGVNTAQLKAYLEDAVRAKDPVPMEEEGSLALSKASENALKVMYLEARSMHSVKPDASHLFLAILRAQDGNSVKYLEQQEITYSKVKEILSAEEADETHQTPQITEQNAPQSTGNTLDAGHPDDEVMENYRDEKKKSPVAAKIEVPKAPQAGKTPVLDSFGFDLTKAAMEDKLDPVVGREKEIERLLDSPMVKLAKKDELIRYRRRQYLYKLRGYEKKGKELAKSGITIEMLEALDKSCNETS
jgi:ATP-dependent Clp protease ATP-binding subunit ClpC